jgi:hypothetical protein
VYLSFDVETDGPVPGLFSMLSIGLCALDIGGSVIWEREYNLCPLEGASQDPETMAWWMSEPQKKAWEHLLVNQQSPEAVMKALAVELKNLKRQYRIVCIAWPVCFDWMFLHWYMHKFVGENPLGRSAKCGVTYSWAMAKTQNPNVDMTSMLEEWEDPRFKGHTHCALDDAREQGARFVNMLREATRHGKDARVRGHSFKGPC